MKILILANNDIGLYNFRHELIETLLKDNEIHIALPDGCKVKLMKDSGCIYHEIYLQRRSKNPFADLFLLYQIKQISKSIKPDLMITYTIKPNIYGGMVARMMNISYCSNITGLGTAFQKNGILRNFVSFLYKISLRDSKTVFFENSENLRIFTEEKIVDKKNCLLLNGAGVNTDDYPYLQFPIVPLDEPIRLLFIGRVMKEKGIDELLQAMKNLVRTGYNLKLDVVGDCEENYTSLLKSYEESGLLNYYGFQENVLPFLKRSSCLVLPSWHEGMANTILEAASCGRPVIASNISGCRESVEHEHNGYLCIPRSSEDLTRQIIRFLELSDDERSEMGKRGREKMIREFDKKSIVKQTIDQIENMMGKEK